MNYDRFWWPANEGAYAHAAERVLNGEVLNRDVQDIRPGFLNLFHALVFSIFGEELVSLRYPLAAACIIEAFLIYLLLVPCGPGIAALGAISLVALSFVQFLNPAAHWYCLFFFVLTVCALAWLRPGQRGRIELIGALVMTVLLFRQLSGAFVAFGVLAYLICEGRRAASTSDRLMGRSIIATVAAVLLWYLITKGDLKTFVLFGAWPLLLLGYAWFAVVGNRAVLDRMVRLALGALIPAAPLLVYHLMTGSAAAWYDDVIVRALGFTGHDMFNKASYAFYILGGLRNFLAFENASLVLNGAYWIILPLIPAFQGIIMSRRSIAGRATGWVPHPLPFLAPFYALVSVHYQHPTYLYYTVSVSLVALLWLTADGNRLRRLTIMSMTCALAVIALQFHAAQPLTRGRLGVIAGARTAEPSMSVNIQRLGLDIGAKDQRRYQHLIALIERETAPDEPIFVLPANAELYFLTRRRNPFRFLNTAIGVTNEAELASVLKALAERPPKLVIFNSRDVTNNAFSRRIMAFVESRYVRLEISRPFEIYRLDPGR